MSLLFNYIAEMSDCITGKGADKTTIEYAERQLQLKFSTEYCELLAKYGFLMIDSHEIMGISKTDRLCVVTNTLSAREKDVNFPLYLYVVENLGIDKILILQDANGEVYQYVPGSNPKKIFPSLGEYLLHEKE